MTDDLWREHSPALVRFATVLVGPTDANDVVVDAFLRCEPKLASGMIDQPRPYLFRAVANHASTLRRSQQRRWARDLNALVPVTTSGSDPDVDVQRAVASLSVGQRAVVYLAYWEDMSERTIADVLHISPGSVRRHLVRARDHLRKALR